MEETIQEVVKDEVVKIGKTGLIKRGLIIGAGLLTLAVGAVVLFKKKEDNDSEGREIYNALDHDDDAEEVAIEEPIVLKD